MLGDVAGQLHRPWEVDVHVAAIIESPGVEIGVGLHLVVGVHIVDSAVHTQFQKIVAEVQTQVFVHAGGLGGRLVERCVAENLVHVHCPVGIEDVAPFPSVRVAALVAHVVGVVDAGEGVDVEIFLWSQCAVEHQVHVGVPVSVDVHGPCVAGTGLCIVDGGASDVVLHLRVVGVHHPSHLAVGDEVVVEDVETVCPTALQTGITRADVQGVAVVGYFQQVGHAGLRHASVVAHA